MYRILQMQTNLIGSSQKKIYILISIDFKGLLGTSENIRYIPLGSREFRLNMSLGFRTS